MIEEVSKWSPQGRYMGAADVIWSLAGEHQLLRQHNHLHRIQQPSSPRRSSGFVVGSSCHSCPAPSIHFSTAATTVLGANPGESTIIFLALPRAETKFTSRDTLEQVEGKFSGPVKREGNVQSMMGQPSLPGARGDDDAATSTVLSTLP